MFTVPNMDDMLRHTAAVQDQNLNAFWLPTCHLVKSVCFRILIISQTNAEGVLMIKIEGGKMSLMILRS